MISANRISIFTFSIRYLSDPNTIFLIYGNKSFFLYIWATGGQMLELNLQVWSPSGLVPFMSKGSAACYYLAASKLWQSSLQMLNNYEIV